MIRIERNRCIGDDQNRAQSKRHAYVMRAGLRADCDPFRDCPASGRNARRPGGLAVRGWLHAAWVVTAPACTQNQGQQQTPTAPCATHVAKLRRANVGLHQHIDEQTIQPSGPTPALVARPAGVLQTHELSNRFLTARRSTSCPSSDRCLALATCHLRTISWSECPQMRAEFSMQSGESRSPHRPHRMLDSIFSHCTLADWRKFRSWNETVNEKSPHFACIETCAASVAFPLLFVPRVDVLCGRPGVCCCKQLLGTCQDVANSQMWKIGSLCEPGCTLPRKSPTRRVTCKGSRPRHHHWSWIS